MTPVAVTPAIFADLPPGTVTSKEMVADPPTHLPSTNTAIGWNESSAVSAAASFSSCSALAGGRCAGHGSGPPCQAASAGSQCGNPLANGNVR